MSEEQKRYQVQYDSELWSIYDAKWDKVLISSNDECWIRTETNRMNEDAPNFKVTNLD